MAAGNATAALAAALGSPQLVFQLSAADFKPSPTPWGPVAAVLMCLLPILFLLVTTLVKPLALPSSTALPLSAALLALIRLAYLSSPPLLVLAHCVVGSLEGLVPLAVIFGAVLLFETMAATGCLTFMMANVRCLSAGSHIAEVFLIGWAFAYTISGVGGFSTPMALAAPMLVSLGHDPLMSLVTVVGLNGLSAHLGSVGMAVWFGFKSLNLPTTAILHIGLKSAAVVGAASFVVAPAAASFLVPWRDLLCNAGFVLLSVGSAVVPTVLFALFSPEFPLVAGGLISMVVTGLLVKYGICLKPPCTHNTPADIETNLKPPVPAAVSAAANAAAALPTSKVLSAAAAATKAATPAGGELSSQGTNDLRPAPAAVHSDVSTSSTPNSDDSTRSSSACSDLSAEADVDSSADRLVSPFEVYCRVPVPDGWLVDSPLFEELPSLSAAKDHHSGNPASTNGCVTHPDLIARRSRSLVAAAAAVGGLVLQPPSPRPAAAAAGPACIFRCPSCAADHRDLMAAEAAADLHRQLSAPAAALRAAAVAVQREGQAAAKQQQSQQQKQLQQPQPALLPALSVVNHATGQAIVINGMDKLTCALKLLLHPGDVLSAHSPFRIGPALFNFALGGFSSPDAPLLPAWTGAPAAHVRVLEVVLRTLPIWLTLVLLLVTHVPALKLQELLRSTSPSLTLHLGTLGSFSLSPALVLQLQGIFTHVPAKWTAELLYIPYVIPFVVVSCVTLLVFRRDLREGGVTWRQPFGTAWGKVRGTVWAMVGALVLAQLMAAGGVGSPAFIIAFYLTSWMGRGYLAIAGFLGALGSFVSGSVLGSNMTQGAIQAVAAERLGVSVTSMLAVQVAGACAGKMLCISSILSAKVVLSELNDVSESEVIRRTGPLALLFVVLAQGLGLIWTLAGVFPDT